MNRTQKILNLLEATKKKEKGVYVWFDYTGAGRGPEKVAGPFKSHADAEDYVNNPDNGINLEDKNYFIESIKDSKCPAVASKFKKYFTGFEDDDYIKHFPNNEPGSGVYVFEFPNDKILDKFLDEVGGAPHPLGGIRAILSIKGNKK